MNCVDTTLTELHEEGWEEGWMVNQTRMWLASQWTVRAGAACPIGEYPGSVAGDMIDPAPTMSTDAFGPIAAPQLDLFDRAASGTVESAAGETRRGVAHSTTGHSSQASHRATPNHRNRSSRSTRSWLLSFSGSSP